MSVPNMAMMLHRRWILNDPRPPDIDLYQAAILALSPTFHLPCTEGTPSTSVADATGNGHTASLNPTTGAFWSLDGPVNQNASLVYDATDDKAEIADHASFDASSIAAAGWFKLTTPNALFGRGDVNASFSLRSFRLDVDASDNIRIRRFSGSNGTTYSLPTGITVDDDQWHWFAWKYTSSAFTAAVDGVDLGSTATSGSINSNTKAIFIGCEEDLGGVTNVIAGHVAQASFWAAPSITIADLIAAYEATWPVV